MVTDVTSQVSKVEGIQEFSNRNQIIIVIVTETRLRSTIIDSVVDITGYSLIRKDRSSDCHAGVATYCLFLKTMKYCGFSYDPIVYLEVSPLLLSQWIITPSRHQPKMIICVSIYLSLHLTESKYPNCAIITAGNFKRFDVETIKKHFCFKHIVRKLTKKDAILDLKLTKFYDYYEEPSIFPSFGLSDRNIVTFEGTKREYCSRTKICFHPR